MVGVGDLTEVLGVVRHFVVFVVGVVVWPIAFVVRSKLRFVIILHRYSVICIINRMGVVSKGAPACRVWNVNVSQVYSLWCDPP